MVVFLLIYRPFRDRLSALTVTLSEISIALLFCLTTAFNFDIDSAVLGEIETASIALTYVAILLPVIAGFVSLLIKLKLVLVWANSRLKIGRGSVVSVSGADNPDSPDSPQSPHRKEDSPQSTIINSERPFQTSVNSRSFLSKPRAIHSS